MTQIIDIEVVCAGEHELIRENLHFSSPPTVTEVLAAALLPPEATSLTKSVWGKRIEDSARLAHLDRLELTRDLVADPKHSRARKVNAKPRRGWVRRIV